MQDVKVNLERLRELYNIAHNATTDLSGCVTDKDVEYQYLTALEQLEAELNELIYASPQCE